MKRCEHVVQFYGQDRARLVRNVAAYLHDSLRGGGAGLVIAAQAQRCAIVEELRRLDAVAELDSRLFLLDDAETLSEFMRDGRPDPALFEAAVEGRARELIGRFGRLRAYGEMVGRLWAEQAYNAAIELERLWNALLERVDFDLYCGYPIDVLSEEFQMPAVRPLLGQHGRIVPSLAPSAEDSILRLRSAMPRYADEILARAKEYAV